MSRGIIKGALTPWFTLGDKSLLLAAVRSDNPLTKTDRELIADIIEGKIKPPATKPPLAYLKNRHRLDLLAAANEVERLKTLWKKSGGVSRRGDTDRAIAEVVKNCGIQGGKAEVFRDQLNKLLRRPKRDREWIRPDRA